MKVRNYENNIYVQNSVIISIYNNIGGAFEYEKKSKIPFFFIQTIKSYVPFTEEDLSYEEVPDFEDLTYATGILYNDNNLKFWGYGLDSGIENQANIKDVYSRIFETISKIKS